jgi:hypothetical protein
LRIDNYGGSNVTLLFDDFALQKVATNLITHGDMGDWGSYSVDGPSWPSFAPRETETALGGTLDVVEEGSSWNMNYALRFTAGSTNSIGGTS